MTCSSVAGVIMNLLLCVFGESMSKIFVILFVIFSFDVFSSGEIRMRTIKFKCSSSNQSISPDFQCWGKTYSRNYSTINFNIVLQRASLDVMVVEKAYFIILLVYQLMKMILQVEYVLMSKKNNEYINVFQTHIKLCEFLSGNGVNVFFKWLIELFKTSLPKGMFHPCPYLELSAYNVSLDENVLVSNNLKGVYLSNLRFYDSKDDNMFTMIHDFEIYISSGQRNLKHA